MNFDFQAMMLIALVVTGAIWGVDHWYLAPKRRQAGAKEADSDEALRQPVIVEYAASFFPIILIVLLLRSFLAEPFRIPSGSMLPTLQVGDFILVNKFSYGLRLPLFGIKVLDIGEPERGDVVVFRFPKDPSVDYIKRIVGLPGDTIRYQNKTVYINGQPAEQKSEGIYTGMGDEIDISGASLRSERLGKIEHKILIQTSRRFSEGEFVVPEGHYFVMGDNRDNSNDSRFWGTVPEENFVGKAFMVWLSWDAATSSVKWDRIGMTIQ